MAAVAAALVGLPSAIPLDGRQGDRLRLRDLQTRAAARAEAYLDELPRLVASEAMTQHVVWTSAPALEGVTRRWIAELAWVRLRDEPEAIAVRDVVEVDGQPVVEGRARLIDLLHGPQAGTLSQALSLLHEGARYNLAPGSRNFNLPTVALFFLHPERQPRFSWKARFPRDTTVSAPGPFEIEFRERSRPTVIRGTRGEQVYARGRAWLTADGTVARTELRLKLGPVDYTLDTTFAHDDHVRLVVPRTMTERYKAPDVEVVSTALYSNYRRFDAGARLIQ